MPEKSLVYGKRSTGGRNNTGKMTVRYMGGGHKKKYRVIDFKREKDGVPAVVNTYISIYLKDICLKFFVKMYKNKYFFFE